MQERNHGWAAEDRVAAWLLPLAVQAGTRHCCSRALLGAAPLRAGRSFPQRQQQKVGVLGLAVGVTPVAGEGAVEAWLVP